VGDRRHQRGDRALPAGQAAENEKARELWSRGPILDPLTATRGHPNRAPRPQHPGATCCAVDISRGAFNAAGINNLGSSFVAGKGFGNFFWNTAVGLRVTPAPACPFE